MGAEPFQVRTKATYPNQERFGPYWFCPYGFTPRLFNSDSKKNVSQDFQPVFLPHALDAYANKPKA